MATEGLLFPPERVQLAGLRQRQSEIVENPGGTRRAFGQPFPVSLGSGSMIAEKIASSFITSLVLLAVTEKWMSKSPETRSR